MESSAAAAFPPTLACYKCLWQPLGAAFDLQFDLRPNGMEWEIGILAKKKGSGGGGNAIGVTGQKVGSHGGWGIQAFENQVYA